MSQDFSIAVLDDNEGDLRRIVEALMESFSGIVVYEARSVPDLRTQLALHDPEIIVTDMHVPPYTGTRVIMELVRHTSAAIIAVSGVESSGGRSRYLEAVAVGAAGYVEKPRDYATDAAWKDKLVAAVTMAVSTHRKRDMYLERLDSRLKSIQGMLQNQSESYEQAMAQQTTATSERARLQQAIDDVDGRVKALDVKVTKHGDMLKIYNKAALWLIAAVLVAVINTAINKFTEPSAKGAVLTPAQVTTSAAAKPGGSHGAKP